MQACGLATVADLESPSSAVRTRVRAVNVVAETGTAAQCGTLSESRERCHHIKSTAAVAE